MHMMGGIEELNISLEPHLITALQPLPSLLPSAIAAQLSPYINDAEECSSSSHTIPYSLLLQISQWSRTSSGLEALQKNTPALDQTSYSMIALLAGTRTSPEKKFPPYVSKDPHTESKRTADDKKAISAVLNAVLSVVGSGFATWWASARTGWRVEWRVLLSLTVALVVAFSEVVLYMIWDTRRMKDKDAPSPPAGAQKMAKHKKKDESVESSEIPGRSFDGATPVETSGLRQRVIFAGVSSPE